MHPASTRELATEDSNNPPQTDQPEGAVATNSLGRRRVQILVDDPETEVVPYRISRDNVARVCFTSRTWDFMVQSLRIALELDNVFVCDHFLGDDMSNTLLSELMSFKTSGQFERHVRRSQKDPRLMYSSLFLHEPEDNHQQLDGLALMVYKLAMYYYSSWTNVSLQLSYYPKGYPEQNIDVEQGGKQQKVLKCVYFPTDVVGGENNSAGKYIIRTTERDTFIERANDRLIVFWGDSLSHKITETFPRDFLVTLCINR